MVSQFNLLCIVFRNCEKCILTLVTLHKSRSHIEHISSVPMTPGSTTMDDFLAQTHRSKCTRQTLSQSRFLTAGSSLRWRKRERAADGGVEVLQRVNKSKSDSVEIQLGSILHLISDEKPAPKRTAPWSTSKFKPNLGSPDSEISAFPST